MQKILSPLRRAVEDYDMIADGERIAVGVSGGKDSVTLLAALKRLSLFYPKHFEVIGITLDTGIWIFLRWNVLPERRILNFM